MLEIRMASVEKTNEGRLPYLAKATDAYNKILIIDPSEFISKRSVELYSGFRSTG